jgi:ABC-type multidrug transport system fused ATPase/permease subunit
VKNVRFLFENLRGYRLLLLLPIALTFAEVAAAVLAAFPFKFIVDKLVYKRDPSFTYSDRILGLVEQAVSNQPTTGASHSLLAVIVFSAAMLVVLGAASGLFTHLQIFLASYIGRSVTSRLRNLLFQHVQDLSLDWHLRQKQGDLVQRITGNIQDIEKLIIDGLVDLLSGILSLAAMLTVMLLFNWQFALLSIVAVPALFGVVLKYTKSIKAATKVAAKSAGHVADIATEAIGAITEVKAFTLQQRETSLFTGYVTGYRSAGLRAGRLEAEFNGLVTVVLAVSTVTVMGVGAYVVGGHTFAIGPLSVPAYSLTIGTLTIFLAYLKQLYQPMRDLSKLTNLAATGLSGAERIREVLQEQPEVTEPSSGSYHRPGRLAGEIRFQGVGFGYQKDVSVIEGLDLEIRAGEKIALIGLSGSGKTTLVKLIPRFHEVTAGSISVDGLDSRSYPLEMLRRNVGFVLQDSVLFEGTIRDNLAIGRPEANQDEIEEAAIKAHIHEDIMRMPGGYDAKVREHGKNFSGGQRQRLAIARAIVRDAPILILDEPTASLDVEAEAIVMRAIEELIEGRTVIMISHRLNTLGKVDRIVVLDGGRIIESGKPSELRKKGGVFARMLAQQDETRSQLEPRHPVSTMGEATSKIARAFLQDILADGPVLTRDILTEAAVCGLDARALTRARRELAVRSRRSRGGEWFWFRPAAGQAAQTRNEPVATIRAN